MPARVGNAAAVLAAAWSLPHRCCQALLRASSSAVVSAAAGGGYSYRGYVGTASQRASKTTASLAGSFVPGGAGRRKVTTAAAAAAGRIGSSGRSGSGSSFVGGGPRGSAAAGGRDGTAMRMVSGGGSDESQFFTDPDAPLDVEGIGPPGPLVGGDQVRHEGLQTAVRTQQFTHGPAAKRKQGLDLGEAMVVWCKGHFVCAWVSQPVVSSNLV